MTWWAGGSDRCCFTSKSLHQAGGPTLRVQSHDYHQNRANKLHASVMETIPQLRRKFTRSVIVSSGERIIDARQEQFIRDIQSRKLRREIFPDIFSEREIEPGVVWHMVRTITAKES